MSTAARIQRADRRRGPARGGRRRRGARHGARPPHLDGLDRGGHPSARSRCARASTLILERQRLEAVEHAGARAVRGRPDGADRGRAGLEGAQVGQAQPALRPHRRERPAAVPGRGARRGRGRAGRQGLDHAPVREEGRRGDLQGARPPEDRGRQAPSGRPRARRRSARSPARSASHRARTARRSSPAARRRSCRCSRSAPPRRASGSTTSRSRPTAATCTTTTSRPTRSGRRASCAARSGATSATARSRSGRSSR